MVRGQRNVPSSGVSVYGRLPSLRVEEFGVATGGGVWVAAGVQASEADVEALADATTIAVSNADRSASNM